MNLKWNKCKGDVWCNLFTVNLAHPHFDSMDGVYIIWHGGKNAKTVYVGQGNIRERLTSHKENQAIKKYADLGVYVTWASVPPQDMNGVEAYLIKKLTPIENKQIPGALPTSVNFPW